MLAVLGLLPFFVFDFMSRRRTLSLQTHLPCGRCHRNCASRYAPHNESLQLCRPNHKCRSCRKDVMHVFTAQSRGLCGLLGFVKSSSRSLWSAATTLNLSRCSYRPQTRQKLLLAPQPYCVIASAVLSCDDLQALASLPR